MIFVSADAMFTVTNFFASTIVGFLGSRCVFSGVVRVVHEALV